MPGTFRSDHYSHSVAARGRDAKEFVAGHRLMDGMESGWDLEPWGRTFGDHSPMVRAYKQDGMLLFLGTDYDTSSYAHLAEVMVANRLKIPQSGLRIDRERFGKRYDHEGNVVLGHIGDACCRLMSIRHYTDCMVTWKLSELST
jgi:aminoglycoside N3'-acetyltransferase